jgi:hypothetical protein
MKGTELSHIYEPFIIFPYSAESNRRIPSDVGHFTGSMSSYSGSFTGFLISYLAKFETALSLLAGPRYSTWFEMQAAESMGFIMLRMYKLSGMV